jgi:hypothetical protein
MTSLVELNKSINLLQEKIDGLTEKIGLRTNKYITIDELEIASAKIINEFSNELEVVSTKIITELSNKIDTCPCNKDILEAIKNITVPTSTSEDKRSYKGLHKAPPPYLNYPKSEKTDMPLSIFRLTDKK